MTNIWTRPHHVIIEVENKNCSVLRKCASLGLDDLKVTDIRASNSGSIKHLIELNDNQAKKIPKDVTDILSKGKSKDKTSLWFESKGCDVCGAILSRDAFLISGKSNEKHVITYSFIVPTFGSYQKIIAALEKSGHEVKILKKGAFEPKPGILTEKQEKVFWLLFKGGFFDYPRKVGLQEFSSRIGTSPSSLSEMIRRGTRRLLEQYFGKKSKQV
jgi:predicted DNA binding protein